MSDISSIPEQVFILPAFGKSQALPIDMSKIREAEKRIIEAKMVNPSTYAELECCFNEAYRDLKRHLSTIGFQLALADKTLEEAKASILLDTYPEFLKNGSMKKSQDNADLRKAFMIRDPSYSATLDRINQLKALESNMDGKIKVIERTCAYMKKQIDLVLRSGLGGNYSITSGRK